MSEYVAKCNEVVGVSGKTLIVPDYIDTSKEVVRCRDCAHYEQDYFEKGERKYCWHFGDEFPADVNPDGFCAWGKRKDDSE